MKNGEHLLSVKEVKNILKEKSREELFELLIESYKTIPLLKEYISVKYGSQDNIEKIFEAYKNKIYNVFFPKNMKTQFKISDAKKAVVEDTNGIGWGFHDELNEIYWEIKWLDLEDIEFDEEEVKNIKEYIARRLEKRKDLPSFGTKITLGEVMSEIVDADEVFIARMDAMSMDYSNDEEFDFISNGTGYSEELIEIILWQKCCYEMENDYWEYEGKCSKCGNSKLYIKEVPNVDFEDQVICKMCGTEFIR